MKKIGIIGAGISGLFIANLFKENLNYQITIFEKNSYLGGHVHTHKLKYVNGTLNVDSGFIVYNENTYPNFINLMKREAKEGWFSLIHSHQLHLYEDKPA